VGDAIDLVVAREASAGVEERERRVAPGAIAARQARERDGGVGEAARGIAAQAGGPPAQGRQPPEEPAARPPAPRAGERGPPLAGGERLLGGAHEPDRGELGAAAALVMAGEDHRVLLAGLLQPLAGDAVRGLAILVGERGVGALAEERVAKHELLLAR